MSSVSRSVTPVAPAPIVSRVGHEDVLVGRDGDDPVGGGDVPGVTPPVGPEPTDPGAGEFDGHDADLAREVGGRRFPAVVVDAVLLDGHGRGEGAGG